MKSIKGSRKAVFSNVKMPAGVEDLVKVYERFRAAYAVTEKYLELISPTTHQSSSNQSLVSESR